MKKSLFTLAALLFLVGTLRADTFRVHYSIRGSGRDNTVQAQSSVEARRGVMDHVPGAVVTGFTGSSSAPPNRNGRFTVGATTWPTSSDGVNRGTCHNCKKDKALSLPWEPEAGSFS